MGPLVSFVLLIPFFISFVNSFYVVMNKVMKPNKAVRKNRCRFLDYFAEEWNVRYWLYNLLTAHLMFLSLRRTRDSFRMA